MMSRTRDAFCTVNEYERLLEVDRLAPHREARIAALTKQVEELRHSLTVIAEACEENYADWVKDGYDPPDPIDFALVTGKKARKALAKPVSDGE